MRILKLRLKNINSLVGENEIDFTQPIFTNDGLFAITGKTGAGKSSILDAISLALYGKTPRVDISGSDNAVMTRGEKDCFAEVVFEVGGKVWKASWKQDRTRTGNLKPVSRQIASQDGEIMADQVRSCDTEIVKILGLTFEQFTKVILLAQGSFAAFLQANKNDKGELLEQITGTEIYGQISRLVFERSAEEKKKLERLSIELENINRLSEEEIATLNQEIELFNQEKTKRDKELTQLEKAKNWLAEIKKLTEEIEKAKEQLPSLVAKQEETAKQVAQHEQDVKQAKETLKQQQPIFKKVNVLDTQIAEKNKLIAPVLHKISELEHELKQTTKKITNQKEALATSTKALTAKEIWAKEHQKYEALVTKFTAIERENVILTQAKREVQDLKIELDSIKKDHTAKKRGLEKSSELFTTKSEQYLAKETTLATQKAELSNSLEGKKLDDLQAEKERKTSLNNQLTKLIDLEKAVVSTQKEVEKYQHIAEKGKKESETLLLHVEKDKKEAEQVQSKIDLLTENIQLIRKVESLEEHRAHLKDGAPCPLCGAEEHPYAMGNVPKLDDKEVELTKEKAQHASLINSIQENEKKISGLNANYKNALQQITKEQQKLAEITTEKSTITEQITTLDKEFVFSEDHVTQSALIAHLEQNENELHQITTRIEKANGYKKDIDKLRDEVIPTLLKEKEEAQSAKNKAENAFQLVKQQLNDKTSAYNQKQTRYENDQSKFLTELSVYGVNQLEDLEKCLSDWEMNQTHIKTLKEQIEHDKNHVQLLEKELENITKSLVEKEKEKVSYKKDLDQLTTERSALFGEKSVEEAEKQLEKVVQTAENVLETSKKERDALTLTLKETTAVLNEKEQSLRQKTAEQLTDKTSEQLQESYHQLKTEADDFVEKMGKNREKLRLNDENIKNNEQKLKEKEKQQTVYNKWKNLDNLIGSSDGKKYRNFAQALTYEHLIGLANKQLQKMSDRYILKRVGDNNNPFDLAVIDKFQNNDERTAQNLSGGEKFIVSLSLALGLSTMASKNMRIDTMFIDEGFGTLDPDYLDVALNALSNLQNDGKIIGVISHIAELKERIATHIEIVPSGNGRSRVVVS